MDPFHYQRRAQAREQRKRLPAVLHHDDILDALGIPLEAVTTPAPVERRGDLR